MVFKARDFEWEASLTQKQVELYDRMYSYDELFADMLFCKGSGPYNLLLVDHKQDDGSWKLQAMDLPPQLEQFDYESVVDVDVKRLEGKTGCFDRETQTLMIDEASQEDDAVLLHEMIHLHEYALTDELPPVYADAVQWSLYKTLKEEIKGLDDIITARMHVLNSGTINEIGGQHDLLFLLKSFHLDLLKGYPLGTVYGYGLSEEMKSE